MISRYLCAAVVLAGASVAGPAAAERVKENSAKATAALEACSDTGAATIEGNGMTSCITGTGHGIVCGGTPAAVEKDPSLKGTCDTFRRSPKKPWSITPAERGRVNVKSKPMPR